jgi:hypothetical protein
LSNRCEACGLGSRARDFGLSRRADGSKTKRNSPAVLERPGAITKAKSQRSGPTTTPAIKLAREAGCSGSKRTDEPRRSSRTAGADAVSFRSGGSSSALSRCSWCAPCEHVFVGAAGYAAFGAQSKRNLTRAIAEARDLPQISLVDAAEVVVLAADDPRTIFQSVGWTTGRSVRARRTQPHARRGAACADCSSWAPARETGASRRSRSSRFSPRATGRGSSDHSGGCSRRSRTIPGDGRLGRTTKREPGTPRRLPLSRVTRQPQKRSWSSRTDEIPTSGPNSWTQSAIAPGGGAKSI